MKRRILLSSSLLLAFFPSLKAQDPVKQDEVVRTTTNLVQVDVVVTNKAENRLPTFGLKNLKSPKTESRSRFNTSHTSSRMDGLEHQPQE